MTGYRHACWIRAETCPNGCPAIVFVDEEGRAFAEAHVADLERFITDLRAAKALGEAQRRPLV